AEKLSKLFLSALLAARHHHHVQIEELRKVGIVVLRHHAIDNDDFAVGLHLIADVLKNSDGAFVIPVVNDPFHDVGITACGNGFEEVAGNCFTAIRKSRRLDLCARAFDYLRCVQKNALQFWIGVQDRSDESTMSTTNVHDRSERRKIVE